LGPKGTCPRAVDCSPTSAIRQAIAKQAATALKRIKPNPSLPAQPIGLQHRFVISEHDHIGPSKYVPFYTFRGQTASRCARPLRCARCVTEGWNLPCHSLQVCLLDRAWFHTETGGNSLALNRSGSGARTGHSSGVPASSRVALAGNAQDLTSSPPPSNCRGNMNDLTSLTPQQLRRAADLQERIQSLQQDLAKILGSPVGTPAPTGPGTSRRRRRKLSPQGLANIRAGVAKRMARKTVAGPSEKKPKRRISAALRKARSESMKARWAARKASGKKTL
jgi:hypothetical protein